MSTVEYRGIRGFVGAEVMQDDAEGYVTGEVFRIAGIAELSKTRSSDSETKYYDNVAAIVTSSEGSDEVTCSVSAIELPVLARITGQKYDEELGILIEGKRANKYFAIGYITEDTDGNEVYVWRYKGTFNIPDVTHVTKNDGTDSNGQELTFTGISTTYAFAKYGEPAMALNVEVAKGLADVSTFFDQVTTPDTLKAVAGA